MSGDRKPVANMFGFRSNGCQHLAGLPVLRPVFVVFHVSNTNTLAYVERELGLGKTTCRTHDYSFSPSAQNGRLLVRLAQERPDFCNRVENSLEQDGDNGNISANGISRHSGERGKCACCVTERKGVESPVFGHRPIFNAAPPPLRSATAPKNPVILPNSISASCHALKFRIVIFFNISSSRSLSLAPDCVAIL